MAFPTILIDSATGANPPSASGAGPSTALTGTAASYSSTTVTLDGSPNLSGVDTTGLHAIYIGTSTGRRFFKITATDNSAKTVTVATAPAGTASGLSWAIGGKLASLTNAAATYLVNAGGASPGSNAGWVAEFASGHAETATGPIDLYSPGDATSGQFVIRGAAGAATKPRVQISGDNRGVVVRGAAVVLRDFTVRSTGVKTSATASGCALGATNGTTFLGLTVDSDTSGNKWYYALHTVGASGCFVIGCTFDRFTGDAITGDNGPVMVRHCFIRAAGGWGIKFASSAYYGCSIDYNTIDNCASGGVYYLNSRSDSLGWCQSISGNTIRGATGVDGIKVDASNVNAQICRILLMNNIFSGNGAYDIDFANVTGAGASNAGAVILSNDHYNATSGALNPSANTELDALAVDPAFTDATNGNFAPTATTLHVAFPNPNPGGS